MKVQAHPLSGTNDIINIDEIDLENQFDYFFEKLQMKCSSYMFNERFISNTLRTYLQLNMFPIKFLNSSTCLMGYLKKSMNLTKISIVKSSDKIGLELRDPSDDGFQELKQFRNVPLLSVFILQFNNISTGENCSLFNHNELVTAFKNMKIGDTCELLILCENENELQKKLNEFKDIKFTEIGTEIGTKIGIKI